MVPWLITLTDDPLESRPFPTIGLDSMLGQARRTILRRIVPLPESVATPLRVTSSTRLVGDVTAPPASVRPAIETARAATTANRPGARTAGARSQTRIAISPANIAPTDAERITPIAVKASRHHRTGPSRPLRPGSRVVASIRAGTRAMAQAAPRSLGWS